MAGRWQRLGHHLSLDPAQRRVLIVLLGLLITYGVVRRIAQPAFIDDPQPVRGDRADDLADRLDPNTADANELAALPGMGRKRADAIVARRDKVHQRDPNATAFASIDDLFYVQGFGRSMVEQARPYLIFPAGTPATRPAENMADKVRTSP